jgi:hypothetical protein
MSRAARVFFAIYFLWHLLVPLVGALHLKETGEWSLLSWHMFAKLPR